MSATATKTQETKRGELTQYFRNHFTKHPEQLQERGNTAALDQYRKDYNLPDGFEVPKNIMSCLNNLKTTLKKNGHSTTSTKKSKSTNGKNGSAHHSNGANHIETNGSANGTTTTVKGYLNQVRSTLDNLERMFA